jgi:hypothetical protein
MHLKDTGNQNLSTHAHLCFQLASLNCEEPHLLYGNDITKFWDREFIKNDNVQNYIFMPLSPYTFFTLFDAATGSTL